MSNGGKYKKENSVKGHEFFEQRCYDWRACQPSILQQMWCNTAQIVKKQHGPLIQQLPSNNNGNFHKTCTKQEIKIFFVYRAPKSDKSLIFVSTETPKNVMPQSLNLAKTSQYCLASFWRKTSKFYETKVS